MEKSFSEDEYDEEDDEEEEEYDEVQNEITADEQLQTSKKRGKTLNLIKPCKACIRNNVHVFHGSVNNVSDFLSELGIEKEDEEGDSPWDSVVSMVALHIL